MDRSPRRNREQGWDQEFDPTSQQNQRESAFAPYRPRPEYRNPQTGTAGPERGWRPGLINDIYRRREQAAPPPLPERAAVAEPRVEVVRGNFDRANRLDTSRHAGTAGVYSGNMGGAVGSWDPVQLRHTGRGPKAYRRSDARVLEEINERLTKHPDIDATDIEVRVEGEEAFLDGKIGDRLQKRLAEECAYSVAGIQNVQNRLKVDATDPSANRAPSRWF